MSGNVDEHCIIVRNFPLSYTERDIHDFLRMFDASNVSVFIAHRTAVVEFESIDHARDILTLLHQEVVDESRLFVEYAPKNRSHISTLSSDTNNSSQPQSSSINGASDDINGIRIIEALKRLYATAENLNINQPPPTHLCYEYPKVNRDIIDAICIALECIPKFYIQVLHLMNRLNLDPPFMPGDKNLAYASSSNPVQYITISTQTDELMWQQTIRSKRKLVESDESEMESHLSDGDLDNAGYLNISQSKRKKSRLKNTLTDLNKQELVEQKQRKFFKMQRIQKQLDSVGKSTTAQTNIPPKIGDAFESQRLKVSNIKIVLPEQLNVTSKDATLNEPINMNEGSAVEHTENSMAKTDLHESSLWTDAQIKENQIPTDQLKVHPIFHNYFPGEISNRLYVKNIAKEVTEADLRAIYDRYLEINCNGRGNIRSIDIRLMTSGRMKGQAFITFNGPYLSCDVDNESSNNSSHKYQIIEEALRETNGLILRGKPLVVVYGKTK